MGAFAVANRYNPPPGWQVPGEGWRPPYDWVPDQAWPPAPIGWNFWIEDDARPADPALAVESPAHPTPIRRVGRWYGGVTAAAGLVGIVALTAVLGTHTPHRHNAVLVTSVPPPVVIATSPQSTQSPQSPLVAPSLTAGRPTLPHSATRTTSTGAAAWSAPRPNRPSQTHRPVTSSTSPTKAPKPPKQPSRTHAPTPPTTSTTSTGDPAPTDTATATATETTPPVTDGSDPSPDASISPATD